MSAAVPTPDAVSEASSLLAELIDIPSPSGSEGEIVARIESLCGEWDIASRRVPSEIGRDSLVLGPNDPALVVAAHVDTIDGPWQADARIEGDLVHGLGAVDDKGGVVACLLAARELHAGGADLDELGVSFAFPVDEERGGAGSRTLALALRPRYAIALEATGLNTAVAEVGCIEGQVVVSGRTAHGARTDLGENAIERAVEIINVLPELGLDRHSHPLLGTSSATIGAIQAGTEFNTVPDQCRFNLDIGILPGQPVIETLASLEVLLAERSARIQMIEVAEPFETPAESRIVTELGAACRSVVSREPERIGSPAWTDAHNFWIFAGSEAVVFGPGNFDTAHTPEEHIDVTQVVECGAVFANLARRGWREPAAS